MSNVVKLFGRKPVEPELIEVNTMELVRLLVYRTAIEPDEVEAKEAFDLLWEEMKPAAEDQPKSLITREVAEKLNQMDRMALYAWIDKNH